MWAAMSLRAGLGSRRYPQETTSSARCLAAPTLRKACAPSLGNNEQRGSENDLSNRSVDRDRHRGRITRAGTAHATMMLGDMGGARVIKVEATDGDESRAWGPLVGSTGQPVSTYVLSCNRNKESLRLGFKTGDGP